jgi:hypothetical protein
MAALLFRLDGFPHFFHLLKFLLPMGLEAR